MMSEKELLIYKMIVRDMKEGVLTIGMNGRITSINPAAQEILALDESIIGQTFAAAFFSDSDNDAFNQAILDAIYQDTVTHNEVVDYTTDGRVRQLFMSTSYLKDGDTKIGVTAVFNDITELAELRNAVKAMEKIKALNAELEKRNEFIKKTFGRYLSDDIVNTILETEEGMVIGGKKQVVTVMFTDLRGFTAMSERMEPHDLIAMLNAYLARMIEIILRHRGTILEFIGDAIVVVFGAPLESNTRDFDAVSCAIAMQNDMENVNAFNAKHGYPPLEMGIGIHTGEVVLGNIGSDKKTKYDIIGKNVNLASRIETYTVGGQVLVSPVVRENLAEKIKTGAETEIMPKGVKTPITIYEVLALDGQEMPSKEQHFAYLSSPLTITYYLLEGKHAGKEGFAGTIFEVSEKECTLSAENLPEKGTTLRFLVGKDELYAKVTGKRNDCALLHLTAGSTASLQPSQRK